MITVDNLTKNYGKKFAINITQLEIPNGQSFGLIGNNGAGKTTFFNLLLDLILPSTGTITNNGIVVHKSEDWKTFTSSYLDESYLISYLTPEEYFYFIGGLRQLSSSDIDEFLVQFHDLFHEEILNQKKYIRDLSKGNQKKVGIIGALIGDPDLIVLDEPFANLDPSTQIKLKYLLKDLAKNEDKTILISSHDLNHVIEVSDRIVLLENGYIVQDIMTSETTKADLESYFESK